MYDIDLVDNPAAVVAALHAAGRQAVCYISAGTWEDWRPDAGQFPSAVIGMRYQRFRHEKWLDIRQIAALAPLMEARLDLCRSNGFDGVELDNVDGYQNDTGFPLTADDQLAYNVWLANAAHTRGLAVALKNDFDQASDLQPYFDFAIAEECYRNGECDKLLAFVTAGKAVLDVEYRGSTRRFCPPVLALGINAMKKHRSLNAWRSLCPGTPAPTATQQPSGTPSPTRSPALTVIAGVTPTLTPTAGPSSTSTRTSTAAPSSTATRMSTATPSPTLTRTSTAVPSPTPTRTSTPAAAGRDAAYWPFQSSDPWNYPIGSGAQYAAETSPGFSPAGGAFVNSTHWGHPVFVATASDPVRHVYQNGNSTACATLRVAAAAQPDPEADGHLHLIDDNHTYVVETYQAQRLANGDVTATDCLVNDLRGPGVYPSWHGTRAYGGSAIGGLIRRGELANGAPHALAVAVQRSAMNKNGPGGNPFVWPASAADSGYQTTYATTGNLYMGSLLAIPPSVNIAAIGLGTSGAGYQIARALQDYGAYVVDATGDNINFYIEPAAANEIPGNIDALVSIATGYLQVVTNNSPGSIGGGGTPRRVLAPPVQ